MYTISTTTLSLLSNTTCSDGLIIHNSNNTYLCSAVLLGNSKRYIYTFNYCTIHTQTRRNIFNKYIKYSQSQKLNLIKSIANNII